MWTGEAEYLSLIPFFKMASCFSLQLSARTLPRQFKVMLALQSEGSQASSRTTLPQCVCARLCVCACVFLWVFQFVCALLCLCFTLNNNISCHISEQTHTHTHTFLSLSTQPFCTTPTLTFTVDFSFTNLKKGAY